MHTKSTIRNFASPELWIRVFARRASRRGEQVSVSPAKSLQNFSWWDILKVARTHFEQNAAGVLRTFKNRPLERHGKEKKVRGKGIPAARNYHRKKLLLWMSRRKRWNVGGMVVSLLFLKKVKILHPKHKVYN